MASIVIDPIISGTLRYGDAGDIRSEIRIQLFMSGTINMEGIEIRAHLTLPLLNVSGEIDSSIDIRGNVSLPMLTLDATGSDSCIGEGDISLPILTFAGNISINELINTDIRIPALRVNGIMDSTIVINANLVLPMLTFFGSGYQRVSGDATLVLPTLKVVGSAVDGAVGTISIAIPILKMDSSAYLSVDITASLVLPMLTLVAEISPLAYQSMVMNIRNNALTLYQNYQFNSFARFNGIHLGATSTKIYNIATGTSDDGVDIEWNVRLPYLDLGIKTPKRLRQVWISFKASGDLIFTVLQPDGKQYEYTVKTFEITEDGIRVKIGKGIRGKYLALDIKNEEGCTIDLDVVRLNLDTLGGRR